MKRVAGLGRPHQRLIWKYALVVVVLVTVAVGSVGLSESYFAYEDSKRAVTGAEADKAASAAVSIGQFVEEILGDLDTVAEPTIDPTYQEQVRRYRGLLGHQSLLSTLTYFDAAGRACVHVYSVEADKVNTWGCADTD